MFLQDIFDHLTYGELSQLYVGGDLSTEGIREVDKPQIIAHIQLGLTALFKRFKLKENEVILNLQSNTYTYRLHSDFAVSNTASTEPVKYLDDSVDTFTDDILKIIQVEDITDLSTKLATNPKYRAPVLVLNKRNDLYSLRTPKPTTLYIPELVIDKDGIEPVADTFKITYRANHPKIRAIEGQYVSFQEEIELPDSHLQALLYYVGSRIMNPVGMANEFHAGNSYYAKYEAECQRLEAENYQLDDIGYSTRFEARGFA